MIVIPAIDLKDGRCVRLLQGRKEAVTVYSEEPVSVAKHWVSLGAELLHVVDLDGAFTGEQKNLDVILTIRKAVDIPLQVGGGIRDISRIEMFFNLGVDRVVLGTAAIEKPELVKDACGRYPDRILVGIDAKDGFVAIKGWVDVTQIEAKELALKMQGYGAAGIVYTDISRDGMMSGPNIEATQEMVRALNIPVIASGGISSIDYIKMLLEIDGLWGVVIGKALYSGILDLREAIKIVRGN